jgi:propanol-preferring alcohol dehydrogenase
MRAVRLTSPGKLELVEMPEPEIGPDDVLLRVLGAGICHSDLDIIGAGGEIFPLPMTLGHEIAGTVTAFGDAVSGWTVGDAGLVYLAWTCLECRQCRAGRENLCQTAGRVFPPTTPGIGPDGGMAEFVRVPAKYLLPLGDLDPVLAAPLADAGLTPQNAIASAREQLTEGSTAVVIGAGGLGNVAIQLLLASTPARIIVIERDELRRGQAAALGTEVLTPEEGTAAAILERLDGLGADAVFDFVGSDSTLQLAVDSVAPGGAIRIVGIGGGTFQYSVTGLGAPVPYGVTIRQQFGGSRADLAEVIRLAQLGKVVPQVEKHPLEDFQTAFDRLSSGHLAGRAVLIP